MKTPFLFPYSFRYAGLALILINITLFLVNEDTYMFTIVVLSVIALLFIGFSREKNEDEQIALLRLQSLQWALYLNYAILLISLLLYKGNNVGEVWRFNLKFPLIFFIIRFRWVIFRLNRSLKEDARLS